MAKVTIRYWASAREAAGASEEEVGADTLAEALDAVAARRVPDTRLRDVLARSSFLVDGDPAKRPDHPAIRLDDGAVVEVLPPFAGG
ncbi:MAG: MoaD/ThiS family protein [Streptosporangiaceae bacterium]|jgi:molybdopterin synthase sulfur carrier subunit